MTPEQIETRRRYRRLLALRRQGRKMRIPADEVWAHVDALTAQGFNLRHIGETAGLTGQLLSLRLPNMDHRRAAAILAVTPAALYASATPNTWVPLIGVQRRVRALMALGWNSTAIFGNVDEASRILRTKGTTVRAETWRQVRDAYDRLSMTHGDSPQVLHRARKNKWPVPLCWDDDTIDDPNAEPYKPRRERPDQIELSTTITDLTRRGHTASQIAERIGVSQRTVVRHRSKGTAA